MFSILNLVTGAYLLASDGSIRVMESGDFAAMKAAQLTEDTGEKWQVRRAAAPAADGIDWRKRESDRFESGWYESPSWLSSCAVVIPADHYLHVSRSDRSVLAFTKSADRGAADIQSRISVFGYLTQYCLFTDENARFWAGVHSEAYAETRLKFARSAEEIIAIYRRADRESGVSSCMSHPAGDYSSSVHPLTPYGDSDLACAYLENKDGHVIARCMVWPDRMIRTRVYGASDRMAEALQESGYTYGDFDGAKIHAILDDDCGRLVLPYLDSIKIVRRAGDGWLVIDRNGDIKADSTCGLESGFECSGCGDEYERDDCEPVLLYRGHVSHWCESCRDSYAVWSEGADSYVRTDNAMTIDGESFPDWWPDLHNVNYCEFSDEYTFADVVPVFDVPLPSEREFSFANWSLESIESRAFRCRIDGRLYVDSLRVFDSWSDLPRCRYIYPSDMPSDFDSGFEYRALNNESLNLLVA